jgi:hypothetical protein
MILDWQSATAMAPLWAWALVESRTSGAFKHEVTAQHVKIEIRKPHRVTVATQIIVAAKSESAIPLANTRRPTACCSVMRFNRICAIVASTADSRSDVRTAINGLGRFLSRP